MPRTGAYERALMNLLDGQEVPSMGRHATTREQAIARFEAQLNGRRSPRWVREAIAAEEVPSA